MNATEIQAEKAIEKLENAIHAAKNGNQHGENLVVRYAAAIDLIAALDELLSDYLSKFPPSAEDDEAAALVTHAQSALASALVVPARETVGGYDRLRASDVVECGRRM